MSDSVIIVNSWRRKPIPIPAQHEPCSSVMFFFSFCPTTVGSRKFYFIFQGTLIKNRISCRSGRVPRTYWNCLCLFGVLVGKFEWEKIRATTKNRNFLGNGKALVGRHFRTCLYSLTCCWEISMSKNEATIKRRNSFK